MLHLHLLFRVLPLQKNNYFFYYNINPYTTNNIKDYVPFRAQNFKSEIQTTF